MFASDSGGAPPPKKRGLSAFTAGDDAPVSTSLHATLCQQNRKLMADGAKHRWAIVNGQAQSVTVLEPIFSDMDAQGCRRVTGYQTAKRARCNGDGTVSVAFWSELHHDWVFNDMRSA